MNFHEHTESLAGALARYDEWWRPALFSAALPDWCRDHPALVAALADLTDEHVDGLDDDPAALASFLAPYLGSLETWLAEISAIEGGLNRGGADDVLPVAKQPNYVVMRDVPGRKAEQVDAMLAAVGAPKAQLLDVCCGKGHLSRAILARYGGSGLGLEWGQGLCDSGRALATRLGIAQEFEVADIFDALPWRDVSTRHVLALHACGDLHRRIIDVVRSARPVALDLAPCCYQKTSAQQYCSLSARSVGLERLALSRNALQLAVTETVTASAREARMTHQQQSWKLAFVLWRHRIGAPDVSFPSVPATWWRSGFAEVMVQLCTRAGLPPPADDQLDEILLAGRVRWALIRRLQLVRFAFRRMIEVALVTDMADALQTVGFEVRVGVFCPRQLTPRNLLVSAR